MSNVEQIYKSLNYQNRINSPTKVEEFKLSSSKFSRNKTIKVFKPSQDESPSPRRYTAQVKPSLAKPKVKDEDKQKSPKRSEK
jgi:hypothetical protein